MEDLREALRLVRLCRANPEDRTGTEYRLEAVDRMIVAELKRQAPPTAPAAGETREAT